MCSESRSEASIKVAEEDGEKQEAEEAGGHG